MEVNARRMELGEFGDVTPEMQAKVRRFLEVRQRLRAVEAAAAPALAEFRQVRELLRQSKLPAGHLLAQMEVMEQRLLRCEPFREEWAEFHLQLAAFQAEQATSEIKRGVRFAIWLDAQDRHNPPRFAKDANKQQLLKEWRAGPEREKLLGSLPIAERRELEELERQWRDNPPESAT